MRLFKTSKTRQTVSLDGLWRFKIDPENVGGSEKWYESFPDDCDKMCVPLCWNAEIEYFKYEGKAWYYTTFESSSETFVLSFEAVQKYCEVYIDGKFAQSHYGGFTGFKVEGKGVGMHSLVVLADNTHDDMNTIPLSHVDWFHYGGISGSVTLTPFDGAYIDSHRITYSLNSMSAEGVVNFSIKGNYDGKAQIIFNEKEIGRFDAKTGENIVKVSFGEIELWNIDNPKLYEIRIVIDTDDIIDRLGFRSIESKDGKIYLNGEAITLKGVNRHNESPDFGFSIPFTLMKRDVGIIKNMNCNMIRGSHYPNPEILLDYFDETGMLFWEEIPMWGFREAPLGNPLIMERGLKMHQEMIDRDYHHPSIIIWGLHNEIDTSCENAYEITKAFSQLVRKNDSSRLITYASNRHGRDICFEFADIISVNIYPGWYGGQETDKGCEALMNKILDNIDRTNSSSKPLIISEFGAGGIFGQSTFKHAKWTEQYQAELMKTLIPKFFNEYNVCGTFVWQYCDIYTAFEKEMERPRTFNNKGMVDEYRRPKFAYYTVKDIYGKL